MVTAPLGELLAKHVPPNVSIDLLTVDVEGLDYDVLHSNDWHRYSPEFILVECFQSATMGQLELDPIARLLFDQGYSIVAKTKNTVLFKQDPSERKESALVRKEPESSWKE